MAAVDPAAAAAGPLADGDPAAATVVVPGVAVDFAGSVEAAGTLAQPESASAVAATARAATVPRQRGERKSCVLDRHQMPCCANGGCPEECTDAIQFYRRGVDRGEFATQRVRARCGDRDVDIGADAASRRQRNSRRGCFPCAAASSLSSLAARPVTSTRCRVPTIASLCARYCTSSRACSVSRRTCCTAPAPGRAATRPACPGAGCTRS